MAGLVNGGAIVSFHRAVFMNKYDLVQYYIDQGNININEPSPYEFAGHTPLALAIRRKDLAMVDLLLRNGASVDLEVSGGNTPLGLAVCDGHLEMVQLLFKHSANIKARGRLSGVSPLHIAIEKKNLDIVRVLADRGADLNLQISDADTPLHLAIHNGDLDMVQLLIENGANVNIRNSATKRKSKALELTPLHAAIEMKRFDIAALLLQHGADINALTVKQDGRDQMSPLSYGIEVLDKKDHQELWDTIKPYQPDILVGGKSQVQKYKEIALIALSAFILFTAIAFISVLIVAPMPPLMAVLFMSPVLLMNILFAEIDPHMFSLKSVAIDNARCKNSPIVEQLLSFHKESKKVAELASELSVPGALERSSRQNGKDSEVIGEVVAPIISMQEIDTSSKSPTAVQDSKLQLFSSRFMQRAAKLSAVVQGKTSSCTGNPG